jgi:hypothetical protein
MVEGSGSRNHSSPIGARHSPWINNCLAIGSRVLLDNVESVPGNYGVARPVGGALFARLVVSHEGLESDLLAESAGDS